MVADHAELISLQRAVGTVGNKRSTAECLLRSVLAIVRVAASAKRQSKGDETSCNRDLRNRPAVLVMFHACCSSLNSLVKSSKHCLADKVAGHPFLTGDSCIYGESSQD